MLVCLHYYVTLCETIGVYVRGLHIVHAIALHTIKLILPPLT
jgi:hypothetical protein